VRESLWYSCFLGWVNLPKGSLVVTLVTGPESYSGNLAYARTFTG
jgi:hypothetical protein